MTRLLLILALLCVCGCVCGCAPEPKMPEPSVQMVRNQGVEYPVLFYSFRGRLLAWRPLWIELPDGTMWNPCNDRKD